MRPLTIGIAGGTASGTTTVARRLVERLLGHPVAFLDQDAYYKDLADTPLEERRAFNFDHPDAFDTELLVAHLRELQAGRAVEKPVYSFAAHTRTRDTVRVNPGDVIILEGILVLALEPVRRELDVKVFVDSDADVRVIRRLSRDIKERGATSTASSSSTSAPCGPCTSASSSRRSATPTSSSRTAATTTSPSRWWRARSGRSWARPCAGPCLWSRACTRAAEPPRPSGCTPSRPTPTRPERRPAPRAPARSTPRAP